MTEQTNETSTFADSLRNKLKSIDVRTLEQTIAKAVGDLVGVEFNCSIKQIEYGNGYSRQGAKFNVSLSEPVEKILGQ
jgi:hypothetical protein